MYVEIELGKYGQYRDWAAGWTTEESWFNSQ